ncbi:unnamed protein product [Caenorhabditis brenneri]
MSDETDILSDFALDEQIEKFENINESLKQEHAYIKEFENQAWNQIGILKLIGFNETCLTGSRPIFKLINEEKKNLFNKQKRNVQVAIIEVENVNGEYIDSSKDYQFGTLIENQEDMGELTIMAQLKSPYRHYFERDYQIGSFFRFEYAHSAKTGRFWEEERGIEKEVKLMDLIDSQMKLESEEFKDRGSQQDTLNDSQYSAVKMALNEKPLMDRVKFDQIVNESPAAKNARRQIAEWDEQFKNEK